MNQNMTTEPTKLWNRQYILVLLLNTLNAFSFYMVVTILSKYLVSIVISIATAGVIVGLFSITSLCKQTTKWSACRQTEQCNTIKME